LVHVEKKISPLLLCLEMVARHHGIDLNVERIVHDFAIPSADVSNTLLRRIAENHGFKAKTATLEWDDLADLGSAYPLIAHMTDGTAIVLSGHRDDNGGEAVVVDPLFYKKGFIFLSKDKFCQIWSGQLTFLKKIYAIDDEKQPFGLRWFLSEIIKQRSALGHVAVAGIFLNIIALVTPLFFQIVIDKVLVHNSQDTLTVLGIGVTIAVLFESTITFLRNYLLLHTTNKLDIRLSTRVFSHLMRLPVNFFETSSAGVIAKHMQQIEKVREFLTGKLFTALLDSSVLILFIPVIMFYSLFISSIVLAFSVAVSLVVAIILPFFRQELQSLYSAEGRRQALLVESIHGVATVKALALEPNLSRRWADSSAMATTMQKRVGKIALSSQAIIGLFEKLMTVCIVWIGAAKVFDGSLSVGELVAIQMLAGRVSSPLVQLVSLVNEFQQTGLSIRMLGEIMNRRPESLDSRNGLRPAIRGGISLEGVAFTYPGASSPALDGVTVTIPAGSLVGVVGRSGSGKTTLLRVLQGLYMPTTGFVRYDGVDLRELDLSHLRRNFGVVLQESFIFHGTIRDNIAMAVPGAPFGDVLAASQSAGAHEFVQKMPLGYDTILEENAANLSGGQKQRLAIARALLAAPPILMLDEATSALDPESEAIIQSNMAQIARDRTVIAVSHRLSTLVQSDVIFVFDQGKILASGTHGQLLEHCTLYQQLWRQQSSGYQGENPVNPKPSRSKTGATI
jgi:ATP-binding cassette subfamily B protein